MDWTRKNKSQIKWEPEYDRLIQKGFSRVEVERLLRFRQDYFDREQATIDHRRLQFARWLVARGKLTEYVM